MNLTPTPERALYLDLVKRCLLNAVHDPKCAVLAKSIYLFDETHPALLEELLATPPDRENLFALIRDKLSVVIEHGTPDEVARVDVDAIQRLLQRLTGPLGVVELKQTVQSLEDLAWDCQASIARRSYLEITEGAEVAAAVPVNALAEAMWKRRTAVEISRRAADVSAMADFNSLGNTQACMETVLNDDIPGDFLEAGVWKGAQCIMMRAVLAAYGVTDRTVYVADSFEGLPIVDHEKYPLDAAHRDQTFVESQAHYAVSDQQVLRNFSRLGLLDDQVQTLKGWFGDTLPGCPARQLAVLRIDGDYYESNMDVLEALYDRVPTGGYIIIDDYGLKGMQGYQAVDHFRRQRGITDEMIQIAPHNQVHYWRKT